MRRDDWSQLGAEYALIGRIAQAVQRAGQPLTIGDDAAVLPFGERHLLWTVDMLIEGVHFRLDWSGAYVLGWKSLAVNLSDIAAMGGTPMGALLSLSLPPTRTGDWLDRFIEGFLACARTYETVLVGGDTNRAATGEGPVIIDVSVLGMVEGMPVGRDGGQPGDWLLVTGRLGASRAGLMRLLQEDRSDADALEAHLKPTPRLYEGQRLHEAGVHAMMDLSDGLASDLPKLARASDCGARVLSAQLPIHPAALRWCEQAGENPIRFALAGGEDYELLIAAAPETAQTLLAEFAAETGTPLTHIGYLTEGDALLLQDETGALQPIPAIGWDHF
jgi:thiamine-monophosphate kinase